MSDIENPYKRSPNHGIQCKTKATTIHIPAAARCLLILAAAVISLWTFYAHYYSTYSPESIVATGLSVASNYKLRGANIHRQVRHNENAATTPGEPQSNLEKTQDLNDIAEKNKDSHIVSHEREKVALIAKMSKPSPTPTLKPAAKPTVTPTATPTEKPTTEPTEKPTETPTEAPTVKSTAIPTTSPTKVSVAQDQQQRQEGSPKQPNEELAIPQQQPEEQPSEKDTEHAIAEAIEKVETTEGEKEVSQVGEDEMKSHKDSAPVAVAVEQEQNKETSQSEERQPPQQEHVQRFAIVSEHSQTDRETSLSAEDGFQGKKEEGSQAQDTGATDMRIRSK
jgi:hypothetical protein